MQPAGRDVVVPILVDGFLDNPVMAWMFPDEERRPEALGAWFDFWFESYAEQALGFVSDGADAAALWAPPDVAALSGAEVQRLLALLEGFVGERAGPMLGRLAAVQRPEQPCWYLNAIAARRGSRARGVGAQLLAPFLERSHDTGVPIYLESSNPRNLSFYRRYGFVESGPCVALDDADARLQPMLREPAAA